MPTCHDQGTVGKLHQAAIESAAGHDPAGLAEPLREPFADPPAAIEGYHFRNQFATNSRPRIISRIKRGVIRGKRYREAAEDSAAKGIKSAE